MTGRCETSGDEKAIYLDDVGQDILIAHFIQAQLLDVEGSYLHDACTVSREPWLCFIFRSGVDKRNRVVKS